MSAILDESNSNELLNSNNNNVLLNNNNNRNNNNNNNSQSGIVPSSLALLCGGIAGTTVDVCLYPIDTLKTRLQSHEGFWKSGGFRGIYRGVSAAFMGSAPGASLFFVSYETMKPIIHKYTSHINNSNNVNGNSLAHMISAGIGEISACTIRVPTEVVKQRMQTGQYNSFKEAITSIYGKSRLGGFYVGYSTTIFREIPFSFIQFPIWERLKKIWIDYKYNGIIDDLPAYQGALCGSISGGIAAAITTPLDVVKTRLMLDEKVNGKRYNGMKDCLSRVIKEEGTSTLFRGIGPRVTWIFIGGFFFFGAYEKSKHVLKPYW